MRRLRPGDWLCALGAIALAARLLSDDAARSDAGWLTLALAVIAIAAALATPLLTATRVSPSGPLLAAVVAFGAGLATAVGLLVDGADIALVGAAALVVGAYLSLNDERSPGAPEVPVERRPAPQ